MLQSYQQVDSRYSKNKSKVRYQKGGFSWTRLQFPVQPAFAMAINKAQDKPLEEKWECIFTKMYLVMDSYMLHCQE